MDSLHILTQEEAEKLVRFPCQEDASSLTVTSRSTIFTLTSARYAIVGERETYDFDIHGRLGTTEGTNQLKTKIRRHHVLLVVDKETGLLLPLVPVVEDGMCKPNTYRMLNHQLVTAVYKGNVKSRIEAAVANNNVETVAGKRQFMVPSVCLLPKKIEQTTAPRASVVKSPAEALGSSSIDVEIVVKNRAGSRTPLSQRDALSMALRLYDLRDNEVMQACSNILDACRTDDPDNVPGFFLGPLASTGNENSVVPIDYLTGDKTNRPPSLHHQAVELINHVGVGSSLTLINRYTVKPDGTSEDGATATPETDFLANVKKSNPPTDSPIDSAVSERTPSSLLPPAPEMPKPSSSSTAAASSSNKRKSGEDAHAAKRTAAAEPVATSTRTAADMRAALIAKMPVLTVGLLSDMVRSASLGDVPRQGSWKEDDSNTPSKLPPAVASGMQISDVFHEGAAPGRGGAFCGFLSKMTSNGMDALNEKERKEFEALSVAALLSGKINAGAKTVATNKIIGTIGMQFLAGALHGWLQTDIDAQLAAVVSDVMLPLVAEADAATADAKRIKDAADATEAELRKTIAELRDQVTSQSAELDRLKEEVKAVAEKQSDPLTEPSKEVW